MSFDRLLSGLEEARAAGFVWRRDCAETGRALYVYSDTCIYDRAWDEFSLLARGLILHPGERRIVATPFPKFFNVGENGQAFPDMGFEVFEKVDGSLAILHHFDGRWRAATKGNFDSFQAKWAERFVEASDHRNNLDPSVTYLTEAVFPENRIVVRYEKPELVLLAAYRENGEELSFAELSELSGRINWRVAKRFDYASFSDLAASTATLPATEEGFVIRFDNGLRLKLKGDEYRRIHALITGCTPLALWEALASGCDMAAIRRDLPEEFWGDFDAISGLIAARMNEVVAKVGAVASEFAGRPDKDVGLSLNSLDADVRPFIFHWRKSGGKLEGRARDALFRHIRPTGNQLVGYTPSYALRRVAEEST